MSNAFTTEFHAEFEAERARWLRRRFLWYAGVVIGLGVIAGIVPTIIGLVPGAVRIDAENGANIARGIRLTALATLPFQVVSLGLYIGAFIYVSKRLLGRDRLIRLTTRLILASGIVSLLSAPVVREVVSATGLDSNSSGQAPMSVVGLGQIFSLHFFACLFLPWTPRESLKPVIPLVVMTVVLVMIYSGWIAILLTIIFAPIVLLPGVGVCWWRQGRFKDKFMSRAIRGRYNDMKRELVDARRIHEALFPKDNREGPVQFNYCYEPMRQIGGDFLFRRYGPSPHGTDPRLSVAIIDVTGHGIPAALTVNRLHGELERLFAEKPDTNPGELLDALNRYVHLTLAEHSVYVTALCMRIDPNLPVDRALEFASGGHPPAFLRSVDGKVQELSSTAFVLGAVPTEAFDAGQQSMRFGQGDSVIAYTDGAIETRDQKGRMLRIEGMLRLIASPSTWAQAQPCESILRHVDQHRFGPITDDTLIVEISRPLQSALASAAAAKASASVGSTP
jgi:serine phosphatase RsbU (regulator of sigma subunit)